MFKHVQSTWLQGFASCSQWRSYSNVSQTRHSVMNSTIQARQTCQTCQTPPMVACETKPRAEKAAWPRYNDADWNQNPETKASWAKLGVRGEEKALLLEVLYPGEIYSWQRPMRLMAIWDNSHLGWKCHEVTQCHNFLQAFLDVFTIHPGFDEWLISLWWQACGLCAAWSRCGTFVGKSHIRQQSNIDGHCLGFTSRGAKLYWCFLIMGGGPKRQLGIA